MKTVEVPVLLYFMFWFILIKNMMIGIEFNFIHWFKSPKKYNKLYKKWQEKKPTSKDLK